MNYKKYSLILSLLILNFTCRIYAQDFRPIWSEEINWRNHYTDAIQLFNGKTLLLNRLEKDNGYDEPIFKSYLLLVDDELKTTNKYELPIPILNDNSMMKLIQTKTNKFLLYDYIDKSEKNIITVALKFDQNNFKVDDSLVINTYELPINLYKAFSPSINSKLTALKLSTDSSKFLIISSWPLKRSDNMKFNISVFDSNAKIIWNRTIEIPIDNNLVNINDCELMNNGDVVLAFFRRENKVPLLKINTSKSVAGNHILMKYSQNNQIEYNFNLSNKLVHDLRLINYKNSIRVVGLYKYSDTSNISGVFSARINLCNNQFSEILFSDFTKNKINELGNDNYISTDSNLYGLTSKFIIHSASLRLNGTIDILCKHSDERSAMRLTDIPKKGSHVFGDLLNVNFNNQNNTINLTRISKKALGIEDKWVLDYYSINIENKYIILFNDDKENLNGLETETVKSKWRYSNSYFVAAVIDEFGVLTKKIIHKNGAMGYIPSTTEIIALSNNKFLLKSSSISGFKNKLKYGILEIN